MTRHTRVTSALPREAYAPWGSRVLAALLDGLAPLVLIGAGFWLLTAVRQTDCAPATEYDVVEFCTTGASVVGLAAFWGAVLVSVLYVLWNYGYRQGVGGSSIGKSVLRIKVVSETTGEPVGFVKSTLRQLAHSVDAAVCFVGYLVPLWDGKRQTLADKLVRTVCIPT